MYYSKSYSNANVLTIPSHSMRIFQLENFKLPLNLRIAKFNATKLKINVVSMHFKVKF